MFLFSNSPLPIRLQAINYLYQCLLSARRYMVLPGHMNFQINSLRPSDAIWRQISCTKLVQVMACCLTAPSHYLNQC